MDDDADRPITGWEFFKRACFVVGALYAVFQYMEAKSTAKEQRLNAAFDSLDAQYIAFEKLCMQYPRLGCYDLPSPADLESKELGADAVVQQRLLYNIFVSMIERAWRTRENGGFDGATHEWDVWDDYVAGFVTHEAFPGFWQENRCGYQPGLRSYIDAKLKDKPAQRSCAPGA